MKPRMPISFVWLLLIALIVPILAACGAPSGGASTAGTSAPAAGATAAGQAAATTAPQTAATTAGGATTSGAATTAPAAAGGGTSSGTKGGTLKILYWQAPTILNTHLAQGDKDLDAGRPILEPLAAFGPDGVPIPVLAAEVPTLQNGGVSPDLKTVTWAAH